MTSESATLWARLRALAQLVVELKARVAALEARLAAIEQGQGARWFQ